MTWEEIDKFIYGSVNMSNKLKKHLEHKIDLSPDEMTKEFHKLNQLEKQHIEDGLKLVSDKFAEDIGYRIPPIIRNKFLRMARSRCGDITAVPYIPTAYGVDILVEVIPFLNALLDYLKIERKEHD